ncbi:hypothetical protein H6F93_21025 [Leptolyngbya sp. FACHB-671]|uniref:hypothetical protein n=1 Tax=Leptolyngbya sp. FACHB-671 TaxID=2692812 RepID=UPI001685108D|nr:hypothetical protein [Leptolyngbya sp. FACHB-671]MBD2069969.1 hypothetical protein [Leptolyngbya sp. FACHB-671]
MGKLLFSTGHELENREMLFTELLSLSPVVIGQVAHACPAPNPFQFAAIVALIGGSGVLAVSTGVGIVGIASTLIGLITTGASIDAILTALGIPLGVTTEAVGVLAWLIGAINQILGC